MRPRPGRGTSQLDRGMHTFLADIGDDRAVRGDTRNGQTQQFHLLLRREKRAFAGE